MSPQSPVVTVAVIDDHPVVAAGIAAWYAVADPPVRLLAAGTDISAALHGPGRDADVVVLDLQPSEVGADFGTLRELVTQGRNVIVYTVLDSEDTALTALDLGAVGYLTKAEGAHHLVAATHAAARQLPFTPPAQAGAPGSARRPVRPTLARREIDVLRAWFQCESKALVAQRLNISVRTVNTYLDRVRIKYANAGRPASTKAHLVARAVQDGLVSLDEL
ncbi:MULTISPECIES: response regulator transcription factor [Streptomyces]|uniref:LuxR family transcriptional regulator n=2 Tax=Streptomyces TaxID=1883 RepID=A0A1E7LPS6_9ACTN|nr:response regulator transcription factor [Streptomyces nanshensis]OEV18212.1 LuxR family transcriptional regulator [Streptomyces nanshensis]